MNTLYRAVALGLAALGLAVTVPSKAAETVLHRFGYSDGAYPCTAQPPAERGAWAPAVGHSRGGRTSKGHLVADPRGRPLARVAAIAEWA